MRHSNLRLKEGLDYSQAIRDMSKNNCDYIIFNEDDTIFAYNWFDVIHNVLKKTIKTSQDFFIIKLFTGYKIFDWT